MNKPACGTEARRRYDRHQAELARTCKRQFDGERCGAVLTANDRLDNVSGWCAECAGDLDAFFA